MAKQIILIIVLCWCVSCAVPQSEHIQVQTVYQDVYIPVPCNEALPTRPQPVGNIELMVINLIEYAQILELKLKACTGAL